MNWANAVSAKESPLRRYGPDLLLTLLLGVVAFLVRRHGLPTDGLWLDDAIVGGGLSPPPSDLLAVSFDHPGYTLALSAWSGITGGSDASLAYPALIAGALGPPALFLALRAFGYERAISMLVAAALVGTEAHVVYSGRLKTYVIDLLIVLAFAFIVPRLARMSWAWRTAVAWTVTAIVVSAFSSFALVATLVAGLTLLIHPASDLRIRAVAVGVSTVTSLALLLLELRTYDSGPIEEQWRDLWDAFPDVDPNPLHFVTDAFEHFRRLAETFINGPQWLAAVCIVAAVAGLAFAAARGEGRVRARYLLLLLGAAFVGGLLGKFPFGPQEANPLSTGERATLWLLPVVAIGLAASLHVLRGLLANRSVSRLGFDLVAYAGAGAILLTAGPALSYPFPGPDSAADYIEASLGPEDSLLLPSRSNWSFAADSSFDSEPMATPDSSIGYVPEFSDQRIHDIASYVEGGPVDSAIKGAERIFVYYPAQPFSEAEGEARQQLASYLSDRDWVSETVAFGSATVDVWDRGGVSASSNEFPTGWTATPTPVNSALFDCLDVSTEDAAQTAVRGVSPDAEHQLVVISTTTRWPDEAAARRARAAFDGSGATDCIASTLETTLGSINYPAEVTARRVTPPRGAGASAVAFTQIIEPSNGDSPLAPGVGVYLNRGRESVWISGFGVGEKPIAPELLEQLTRAAAARIDAKPRGE